MEKVHQPGANRSRECEAVPTRSSLRKQGPRGDITQLATNRSGFCFRSMTGSSLVSCVPHASGGRNYSLPVLIGTFLNSTLTASA